LFLFQDIFEIPASSDSEKSLKKMWTLIAMFNEFIEALLEILQSRKKRFLIIVEVASPQLKNWN
jgi:hypothetical protein